MKKNQFPVGWDEQRIREVIAHYEAQTQEEATLEDETDTRKSNRNIYGGKKRVNASC